MNGNEPADGRPVTREERQSPAGGTAAQSSIGEPQTIGTAIRITGWLGDPPTGTVVPVLGHTPPEQLPHTSADLDETWPNLCVTRGQAEALIEIGVAEWVELDLDEIEAARAAWATTPHGMFAEYLASLDQAGDDAK